MIDATVNKKEEEKQEAPQIRHSNPPYYAYFERADGSWYMLWMTHAQPKTRRGHPWHVHATYDKHGATKPNLSSPWFEQPYGMRNWAFDTLEEAVEHFYHERYLLRLARGYKLVVGNIPEDWPVH
jgi:hypothetical protein